MHYDVFKHCQHIETHALSAESVHKCEWIPEFDITSVVRPQGFFIRVFSHMHALSYLKYDYTKVVNKILIICAWSVNHIIMLSLL